MRKTLLAMLAVAACSSGKGDDGSGGPGGDDTSDADKRRDYDDVAASLGANLAAGELALMVDSINMAYGRMPAGFTITPGPDYQKVTGTRNGLMISYRVYCRDAADALAACNGAEDHEHVKPVYTGAFTIGSVTIDGIDRTAAWIVRNPSQMVRLGGSGTAAFASHTDTTDYTFSIMDTSKNLIFDPAAPTSPSSGTMDITATIDRTRGSATRNFVVAAHVVVTAADTATVTLDQNENYTLTISSGEVVHR